MLVGCFNPNFAFVWVSPESSEISSPHKVEGEFSRQVGEHWAWSDPCCWTCGCSGRSFSRPIAQHCPGQKSGISSQKIPLGRGWVVTFLMLRLERHFVGRLLYLEVAQKNLSIWGWFYIYKQNTVILRLIGRFDTATMIPLPVFFWDGYMRAHSLT